MRNGFTLIQIKVLLTVASLAMVAMLPSTKNKLDAVALTNQRMSSRIERHARV